MPARSRRNFLDFQPNSLAICPITGLRAVLRMAQPYGPNVRQELRASCHGLRARVADGCNVLTVLVRRARPRAVRSCACARATCWCVHVARARGTSHEHVGTQHALHAAHSTWHTAPCFMSQILVVEDDPDIAELIRHYLEKSGHAVQVLASGAAVLPKVRGERPDLIVLDLMLPGLDGLMVCQALRVRSAHRGDPDHHGHGAGRGGGPHCRPRARRRRLRHQALQRQGTGRARQRAAAARAAPRPGGPGGSLRARSRSTRGGTS